MFDPISIFWFMIMLNSAELPNGRLSVKETIEIRENIVVVESINNQITIRNGL